MKLFCLLLLFSSQVFAAEICEELFKAAYPGKLLRVSSKTATNNYGKLKSSLSTLQRKGVKIALGDTLSTPQAYLKNLKKHYTGKTVGASSKINNYFDEIDEVFEGIKNMSEKELMTKVQESMKRYSKSYKKTHGKLLEIPGDHTYSNGLTLNKYFKKATKSKTDFSKYVDDVLMSDSKTSKVDILRGELMAWYGQEMDLFFEPLIQQVKKTASQALDHGSVKITKAQVKNWTDRAALVEEVKEAKYKIARGINRFEQFKASQIETVSSQNFILSKGSNLDELTYLELGDYETYVRSLMYDLAGNSSLKRINGKEFKIQQSATGHKNIKKMYNDLDEGDLGILSIQEYRNVVSKNTFPMFAKRHDMRHIHYAISHPRSLGVIMGATRSQNHLRFVQVGGMYEGIETFQYSFESSIAKYFSKKIKDNTFLAMKRNLDLEESMITLSMTPKPFSYGLGDAHGHGSHWRDSGNSLNGWVPKKAVSNIGTVDEKVIIGGNTRLKRGIKDGKQEFEKFAEIKMADGTTKKVPVYLDESGNYASYTSVDPNGMSFNEDIELMVNSFQKRIEDVNDMRATIGKRADDNGKLWYDEITEEEEIIMHMYNYQKDPQSPAIKIAIQNAEGEAVSDISFINRQMLNADGVKWKNDGRTHYSGDGSTGEFGFGSGIDPNQ